MDWFLNSNESSEALENLFGDWVALMEQHLSNPDISTKDLISAGRIIGELASKFPSKDSGKDKEDRFSKMSPAELRAFISERTPHALASANARPIDPIMDSSIQSTSDLMKKHGDR